jgi:hypothetical protein
MWGIEGAGYKILISAENHSKREPYLFSFVSGSDFSGVSMRFSKRVSGIVIGSLLLTCLVRFECQPGGFSVAQTNEVDAIRVLVE